MKLMTLACLATLCLLGWAPTAHATLMVHYQFDENPTVNGSAISDSSGNSVTGTFLDNNSGLDTNKYVGSGGALGGAIDFDGNDLTLSDIVEFQVGTLPGVGQAALAGNAPRTFAAWVNPDSLGDKRILSYGGGAAGQFLAITLEGDDHAGDVYFRRSGGYEIYTPSQGVNPIDIDNPDYVHIVAVVPDGATNTEDMLIYVNGVAATLTGGGGASGNPALDTLTGGATGYIGVGRRGLDTGVSGGSQAGFDGQIADFQFYAGALSSDQVAYLFANPGSVVPEPSTCVLMLAAVAGSLLQMRRFPLGKTPQR